MRRLLLSALAFVLTVTAFAQNTVVIPAGNPAGTSGRQPLGGYWGYENSQLLYTAAEIGAPGNISEIAFYVQSVSGAQAIPTTVYMYETAATTLSSANWPSVVAQGTQVFQGTTDVNTISAPGWYTITLNTPFYYSGNQSLVVLIANTAGGTGTEGIAPKEIRRSAVTNLHQQWNQDTSPVDASTSSTLFSSRPNIQITMASNGTDVAIARLLSPSVRGAACGGIPAEPVSVLLRSTGTQPVNGYTLNYSINGGAPVSITSTNTIAPGQTETVTFPTAIAAQTTGQFKIEVTVSTPGDVIASNNRLRDSSAVGTSGPFGTQIITFSGYSGTNLSTLYSGWREGSGQLGAGTTSDWTNSSLIQQNFFGGKTAAKINLFTTGTDAWIVSKPFEVGANQNLEFKAAVTAYAGTNAINLGSDDTLKVLISTDCGSTFSTITAFGNGNKPGNTLTDYIFPLSQYAGKTIVIAFRGTDGRIDDTEDADFHITDIFVGTPAANDAGVIGFTSPVSSANTCAPPANQPVTVTIRNSGAQPQTNFPVAYSVNGGAPVVETFTQTLQPGTTASFTFATIPNTLPSGTYNFVAFTQLPSDSRPGNDTARTSYLNAGYWSLGETIVFDQFTGANLATLYPGWRESSGPRATGTTSSWTNANAAQNTGLGKFTARDNVYTTGDRNWIISKPVQVQPGMTVEFDVALTEWTETTATAFGSDDTLAVRLSTDCGQTWNTLRVYTADSTTNGSITNVLQRKTISIAAYAGQTALIAWYSSDGTVDDTPDNDIHIADLALGLLLPNDVRPLGLANYQACALATPYTPVFRVQNNGINTQTALDLNYQVNNGPVTTVSFNQAANPSFTSGQIATISANAPLNLTARGTYTIRYWTTLQGDQVPSNDTAVVTLTRYETPTALIDFTNPALTNRNLNGFYQDYNTGSGTAGTDTTRLITVGTFGGSRALSFNIAGTGRQLWYITPNIKLSTANSAVVFSVGTSGAIDADDKLEIRVSTNCGSSWTTTATYTSSSSPALANGTIASSLAAYVGQDVRIALVVTDGTTGTPVSIFIDNLEVRGVFNLDAAPLTVITPICSNFLAGEAVPIQARIRNVGLQAASNFQVNVTIGTRSYPPTVVSSTIASNGFTDVTLGLYTAPNTPGAIIPIRVWITWPNDQNNSNDTLYQECTLISDVQNRLASNGTLRVFPNPAKSQVTVEVPALMTGEQLVSVVGLDGRVAYQQLRSVDADNRLNLQLGTLPKGVYFLQVGTGDAVLRHRIVLE